MKFLKKTLWISIIIAMLIGILMVLFISKYASNITKDYLSTLGCGILIAGASLSGGGFLGFIFGIPSILQNPTAKIKYNDNLIKISDWLTTIVVGVGLTQLYHVPTFFKSVGTSFETNFGGGDWARNVSISIIGYFFLLGFLMMYFWTKTDYSTIMKALDDDLNRQLENTQEKLNIMGAEIAAKETQARINKSNMASDTNNISQFQQSVNDNLNNDLNKLKDFVNQTLPTKKITVPDDPQKNRWDKGRSENNGKKIRAQVTKNEWQNLFDVLITISNIDNTALISPVAIFVHDSYKLPNDVVYVTPNNKGVEELSVLAYEAFTIGALFADGTELELDLNDQTGYPPDFYWKK